MYNVASCWLHLKEYINDAQSHEHQTFFSPYALFSYETGSREIQNEVIENIPRIQSALNLFEHAVLFYSDILKYLGFATFLEGLLAVFMILFFILLLRHKHILSFLSVSF